jgi:hypothetical protein
LDNATYPLALFKELYHQRWPVEEDYKVIKLRVEVENWSGKSTLAVSRTSMPRSSPPISP